MKDQFDEARDYHKALGDKLADPPRAVFDELCIQKQNKVSKREAQHFLAELRADIDQAIFGCIARAKKALGEK